jgi:hypothetical protein
MAFNPFHGFRKHQKKVFAVMVIVCMFVFILQFTAGADPISKMMGWFGSNRRQGDVVTTIYGDKVNESDLARLQRFRLNANTFLGAAAWESDPAKPRDPNDIFGDTRGLNGRVRIMSRFSPQLLFGGGVSNEELLDFMLWKHQADKLGLQLTESDIRKLVNRVSARGDLFGNTSFTSSALVKGFASAVSKNTQRGITPDELLEALTDEFRVLLAKETLLGDGGQTVFQNERGSAAAEPAVTPWDFLQFYRDQFTQLDLYLVPVKVEDFVAAARQKYPSPPEDELHRLFSMYKTAEPSPERAQPAFTEPSRVRADWVVFSRDLPYFRERAKTRVAYGPLADAGSIASATTALGFASAVGSCLPAVVSLMPVTHFRPALADEYSDYERRERKWPYDSFSNNNRKFHDYVYRNAEPIAVTVAMGFGAALSSGAAGAGGVPLLQVVAANYATAATDEIITLNRMVSAEVSLFLSLSHAPAIGCPDVMIPAAAYYSPLMKQEQATSLLEHELETKYIDKAIAAATMDLRDQLNKIKPSDTDEAKKNEARKIIDDAIARYGLQRESMKRLLDRFEVEKDDSIKTLREAFGKRSRDGSLPSDLTFAGFLNDKWSGPTGPGREGPPGALKGLYLPGMFDVEGTGDRYFVWQVEAPGSTMPKTLADARKSVEAAWYYQRARDLARQKAEEINRRINELKGKDVVAELRKDPELARYAKDAFNLYRVSRLQKSSGFGANPVNSYGAYVIDTSKIALAPANMVDDFVKNLKRPGDTKVYWDRPEANLYVALLESRNNCDYLNPTERQAFNELYANVKSRSDLFWERNLMPELQRERVKRLINEMRRESGAATVFNEKTGMLEYKLPEGVRARGVDRTED